METEDCEGTEAAGSPEGSRAAVGRGSHGRLRGCWVASPLHSGADTVAQGTRLQGAYAKVTGFHCASSSCSSVAWSKQVLQAFAAGLEAISASVCVIAENWNDFSGGVMSDRHPGVQFFQVLRLLVVFVPTSHVKQYFPLISGGVYWGVTEVVSAAKDQTADP